MAIEKDKMTEFVGKENVIDDPGTLHTCSKDISFAPMVKPACVTIPKNSDEIQTIVKWANRTVTPLVPVSSGGRMSGGTLYLALAGQL